MFLRAARLLSLLVVVALGGMGAECPPGPNGDGGPSPPTATWKEAFDTGEAGSMSGVWGTGPDDVFAVGGGEQGTVVHYDGQAWSKMDLPAVPLLVWVHGTGPDDVFAVGVGGGAVRYDGSAWTRLDTGTTTDLWGVFAVAPNDVWVVGGDVDEGEPLILHYDGTTFTPVPVPAAENPLSASALFKVWGISDKLFAVGQRGLILEHQGGQWVNVPAGAEANEDFVSLWGTSEDHIVAVGGRANARVATYDGQSWDTIAPFGLGGINGVFMSEPAEALVVGVFGLAGIYDVASGEIVEEDPGTFFDLHAVWGDGAGRHYAVGGNFLPPYRGIALVREEP